MLPSGSPLLKLATSNRGPSLVSAIASAQLQPVDTGSLSVSSAPERRTRNVATLFDAFVDRIPEFLFG
jgi:hypothetical protein